MRFLRPAIGVIALILALAWAYAFYDRYWIWRDCFNELGRCWDSATEQVYLEQSGAIWGMGTLLFAFLAIMLLWPRKPRARR